MLHYIKNIKYVILFLFVATSAIQSVLPVFIHELSPSHSADYCDTTSCSMCESGGMCHIDGHDNSDEEDSLPRLCNCSHHSDMPYVLNENIQVKGTIDSPLAIKNFLRGKFFKLFKEKTTTLFAKDIFHPPRMIV